MKYTAEMGWGAIIYIPGFIKTGSVIQKLIGEDEDTYRHDGGHLILFFQNEESRLKKEMNVQMELK
jgi:hypothetical protein